MPLENNLPVLRLTMTECSPIPLHLLAILAFIFEDFISQIHAGSYVKKSSVHSLSSMKWKRPKGNICIWHWERIIRKCVQWIYTHRKKVRKPDTWWSFPKVMTRFLYWLTVASGCCWYESREETLRVAKYSALLQRTTELKSGKISSAIKVGIIGR